MAAAFVVLGALLLGLAWFFWPRGDAASGRSTPGPRPGVDRAELEAAEREVQDAPDEDGVRDWGPGAPKPPLL